MDGSLYRAVWRWHFYAGLIILPVLVWLAATGSLYLYKPEIERFVYREWVELPASARPLPLDEMIRRVERQAAAEVVQIARPASASEAWRMTIEANGTRRTGFVDPATGHLLGATSEGGLMKTIRDLHSLVITGPIGNALIEIVAGWTIILVLTGFYLWWPRGGSRAFTIRGRPKERRFWRNLHASTGALVGVVILFLAVTGMPWSVFWGAQVQGLVTANGLGRPKPPGASLPGHGHGSAKESENLPWSLQALPHPEDQGSGDVGPGRVMALAEAQGLEPPYTLSLPSRAHAPYSVSRTPERAQDARTIHVEGSSGRILQDISYAEFGSGARVIEWGIYTHQGQQYGEPNRLLMLAGCMGVLLLSITAPILWWKRRRNGRLSAPPPANDRRQARNLAGIMIGIGIIFPLTGLSMLGALVGEWLLARSKRGSSNPT